MIIKYYITAFEERNIIYEEMLTSSFYRNGHIISKTKAMQMIQDRGYVKVHECEHGVCWDTPDEPSKRRWQHISMEDLE